MNQTNIQKQPIDKPKVSVVICAYNAAHCISGILSSLEKQTTPQENFEVLVVNDGSTDNTIDIVKQAQNTNTRIVNKAHTGLSATRNAGIYNAQAEIIAIIDADCAASPQWIEEIIKETKNHDIVTGNTTIPKSTFLGDCISGLGYPGGGHLGFHNMWHVDENGYTDHIAGGNCAFVKEKILALGAFNPALTITADDVYLSMKALEAGLKIKYNPHMVMTHDPRKDLKSFMKWHYARGRGSYVFRQYVPSFNKFYKLRLWSTKNMMKKYYKKPSMLIVMLPLLVLSFVPQKIGYIKEKIENTKNAKNKTP